MFDTIIATITTAAGPALAALASATPVIAVTGLAVASTALVVAGLAAAGSRRRATRLADALADAGHRLAASELLLAETTAELSQARTRLEQLTVRQESSAAAGVRSGFRQAIALSRHGASTRQLIDSCGLSQGEAHLIQTLYGRPGASATEDLH